MAITIGPHMLHSTPAMPARTSQTAGGASGAILASSQHSSWHHQSNTPNTNPGTDFQPDRPIGYGAFGVVWSVTDPRDGKRVALKKLPNVFQSLVSSKRVFRELKMMRFFQHENVLSCLDILQVR